MLWWYLSPARHFYSDWLWPYCVLIPKSPEEHTEVFHLRRLVDLDAHPQGPQPFVHHLNVQLFQSGFPEICGEFIIVVTGYNVRYYGTYKIWREIRVIKWDRWPRFKKDQQNASNEKNPEHLVQLQVQLNLWTSPDKESLGQPLQKRIRFFINLASSL